MRVIALIVLRQDSQVMQEVVYVLLPEKLARHKLSQPKAAKNRPPAVEGFLLMRAVNDSRATLIIVVVLTCIKQVNCHINETSFSDSSIQYQL